MIRPPPRSPLFPYTPLSRSVRRSGIDGEPHRHTAEPQRVAHAARDRRRWILVLMEDIVVVQLQDQRNLACKLRRTRDRKSTRLNSSHLVISYAVFCLKKKKN